MTLINPSEIEIFSWSSGLTTKDTKDHEGTKGAIYKLTRVPRECEVPRSVVRNLKKDQHEALKEFVSIEVDTHAVLLLTFPPFCRFPKNALAGQVVYALQRPSQKLP